MNDLIWSWAELRFRIDSSDDVARHDIAVERHAWHQVGLDIDDEDRWLQSCLEQVS